MQIPRISPFLEVIALLSIGTFLCENLYYYYIFWIYCPGWPTGGAEGLVNVTKILVITDTHIMGPIKSYRIDKWRREWEMHQAYKISNFIYQPDLIIFLGDVLDEASFVGDDLFEEAVNDFNRIFPFDDTHDKPKRLIIAGNHDIGFHDTMLTYPYFMYRFADKFKITQNVQLKQFNDINIILTNSMTFYNDTCPFCQHSKANIESLANYLRNHKPSSSKLLLTHIPFYRQNETSCDYPNGLSETVKENIIGKNVLHQKISHFLLEKLKPNLILSGHAHMNCNLSHNEITNELTVTSYNHKYAEKEPGFLQVSGNSTNLVARFCPSIDEKVVFMIYATTVITIIVRIYMR